MTRYVAKLLFQFRVTINGGNGKRRLCEERIINFVARSPREALRKAKRYGKSSEYAYRNSDGNPVSFEFVGLLDVMELGLEARPEEVWYDISQRLTPMERRKNLIPTDRLLVTRLSKRRH